MPTATAPAPTLFIGLDETLTLFGCCRKTLDRKYVHTGRLKPVEFRVNKGGNAGGKWHKVRFVREQVMRLLKEIKAEEKRNAVVA